MAKIYIASSNVVFGLKQHAYLVFDIDGNVNTTVDQEIIRGGPTNSGYPYRPNFVRRTI